jgi:hypothetical protein
LRSLLYPVAVYCWITLTAKKWFQMLQKCGDFGVCSGEYWLKVINSASALCEIMRTNAAHFFQKTRLRLKEWAGVDQSILTGLTAAIIIIKQKQLTKRKNHFLMRMTKLNH